MSKATKIVNQYEPDQVSAPGEALLELLEERGISQAELAQRTGRPKKTINEIIKGKTGITPDTALQLELALGTPASFWNDYERRYREYRARVEQEKSLSLLTDWPDPLPIKEMTSYGWIRPVLSKTELVREVLHFFGVATPKSWEELGLSLRASYRRSRAFDSSPAAVAAWLRRGHIEAQRMECEDYDEHRFRSLLPRLRPLTRAEPEVARKKLIRECAACGVAVVIVRELPGTRLFGAARWITPHRAVIQLSLRYKTNDQFWFSFYHEAGHVVLHGKREFFVDQEIPAADGQREIEANEFATDMLISIDDFARLKHKKPLSAPVIREYAEHIDIAPGIVIGRLQHEGRIPWKTSLNQLKERFAWPAPWQGRPQ